MRVVLDCETDGIENPSKIHCIVTKDLDNGKVFNFVGREVRELFPAFSKSFTLVVMHNGIAYDLVVLRDLLGIKFGPAIVRDTLVLSRLFEYRREGGHSLEAWGNTLKHPKVGLDIKDWSTFTPNMLVRCINDVELTTKLYNHLMLKARVDYNEAFAKAIETEHKIEFICQEMHENGYGFDLKAATELYQEISERVNEIDQSLAEAFPPKVKETQLKTKVRQDIIPFNPNSPTQIVERLGSHWKPTEKTESGKSFKVSETNLATLKDSAPEACKRLVERLLLAGRVRTLEQWFKAYDETDGRIRGTFVGLGTWTHRMSHRNPNMGNVAAPKSIKYKGRELALLATSLGKRMRGLWTADAGQSWLVGTDAEGIQLRIFAHYINDPKFTEALINGQKDLGTDPHSLNAAILECDRDTAKTFIYAFLLGAGDRKIGDILGRGSRQGAASKRRFIEAYPGLAKLKEETIPRDVQRGYFEGFDGRLVKCDSDHLMMAGYLQTGEACLMKEANILWRQWLEEKEVDFEWKQVGFVHDEFITEVFGEIQDAQLVGELQAESIKVVGERLALNCPLAGAWQTGLNWYEIH